MYKPDRDRWSVILLSPFEQDVLMKHKLPQEWQILLTAMSTLKFLISSSNAKVTASNHLFYYSSNITKNDYKPAGMLTKLS
jgi:hypothetical protein